MISYVSSLHIESGSANYSPCGTLADQVQVTKRSRVQLKGQDRGSNFCFYSRGNNINKSVSDVNTLAHTNTCRFFSSARSFSSNFSALLTALPHE